MEDQAGSLRYYESQSLRIKFPSEHTFNGHTFDAEV